MPKTLRLEIRRKALYSSFIQPKIIIEQLLRDVRGELPWDYSFFCYHGPGGFDYSFSIVSPDGKSAAFKKDWTLLETDMSEHELAPHLGPANFEVWCKWLKTFPRILISSESTSTRSKTRF